MLKSTRKEHPVPYPGCPPLQLLVNQEKSVLCETTLKNVFSIEIGFFHCHSTRFTRVISVSASDLAIAHTCKHFSYQLLKQIAFFWMRSSMMCIPRSYDYNINVRRVQPPLPYYCMYLRTLSHLIVHGMMLVVNWACIMTSPYTCNLLGHMLLTTFT